MDFAIYNSDVLGHSFQETNSTEYTVNPDTEIYDFTEKTPTIKIPQTKINVDKVNKQLFV